MGFQAVREQEGEGRRVPRGSGENMSPGRGETRKILRWSYQWDLPAWKLSYLQIFHRRANFQPQEQWASAGDHMLIVSWSVAASRRVTSDSGQASFHDANHSGESLIPDPVAEWEEQGI